MLRPNTFRWLVGIALGSFAGIGLTQGADEAAPKFADNWYKTEVLIFLREEAITESSETWDPSPKLAYTEHYRFLIDRVLADQRLATAGALQSQFDEAGVQRITAAAPATRLDIEERSDAVLESYGEIEDAVAFITTRTNENTVDGADDLSTALDPNAAFDPNSVSSGEADDMLAELVELEVPDPNAPLLAVPYQSLDKSELAFSQQATNLRRAGNKVVFHKSWWAQLDGPDKTAALVIDSSGDPDTEDWPVLQGSLHVYRTRYLHVEADLWLNNDGRQLPEGWMIEPPPLGPTSVVVSDLGARALNPWDSASEAFVELPIRPVAMFGESADTSGSVEAIEATNANAEQASSKTYPWRHAIVGKLARRMRSGEIHYIDHPVVGIIVRISPMTDDALPLAPASERDFRERHQLPVKLAPIDAEAGG